MSKKMLINASHPEENRVAIVVDGLLSELDIEIAGQEQTKGNIYKAVVARVETGLQAAFVDYGAEKMGFLQIGEIHPNLYPAKGDSNARPRINDILRRGQEILVQIVKEERGTKGAALTTYLSLPGRYMVLMPDSATKGVSRKIANDSERKKLKSTMAELDLPEKMGYIVRTAGIGKDKDELRRDFDYLVRLYEGIVARQDQVKAPAQLYQESNLAIRSIRDYFTTEMDEVLIDSEQVYKDTKDFFALVMPELSSVVRRHRERRPIFSRYQIEEQIEGLAKNQIPLPSGGSIVIDQTEALVAIDVNSGKMSSESSIEATATKTNIEAAAEVGRQLRLRDLGGLVVIDFIDMRDRKNIREVEQALRKSLKDDKAKVSVGRISQFGLMEMSRQRLKPTLSVGAYVECPHCKGIGRVRGVEAQAVSLLRLVHAAASKNQIGRIEARVPVEVANYLNNTSRKAIVELEKQLNVELCIFGQNDILPGDLELEQIKREKVQQEKRDIDPVSHANQIEVALAAQQDSDNEPAEEPATENDETTGNDTEQPATPAKKRRRRRRKKPANKENAQATEENAEATNASTADSSAEAGTDEPAVTSAEQPAPAAAPETEAKATPATEETPQADKPKRRTRRSSRKKTPEQSPEQAQENAGASDASSLPESAATATETASSSSDAATDEASKPKRRSRRSSAKKKEAAPQDTAQQQPSETPAESATSAAEKAPETAEKAPETAEKLPAKARRSPRKKAVKSAESSASETAAASETPAVTEATQPAAEESSAAPATSKPAKPRTRRAPRKKATSDSTVSEAASEKASSSDSETAAATPNAEEKPAAVKKPASRSRRAPARKKAAEAPPAEATATDPPAAQSTEAATGQESAPAAKPARRSRRTSTAKTAPAATAETATEEVKAPAKRRPGRPRKVKPEQSENND